jgi:D-lactate dehydrogenase (cytochrome)
VHPVPPTKQSVFIDFDALGDAAAFCAQVAAYVPDAAAIEIVSAATIRTIQETLPDTGFPAMGESLVMIELHAGPEACAAAVETILSLGADFSGHEYAPPAGADLWADRHRFTRQISAMSENGHPYRFDAAVPLDCLRQYLDKLAAHVATVPGRPPACVFGHAGAGIVHVLLPAGPALWSLAAAREFRDMAIAAALRMGGTASGEHGIGLTSVDACARENATALPWMRAVKRALDPAGIMNPGKVLGPLQDSQTS